MGRKATFTGTRTRYARTVAVFALAGIAASPLVLRADESADAGVRRDRPPHERGFQPGRDVWRPGRRPRGDKVFGESGGRYHAWMEEFRKKHPDQYQELMRLKEENPDEFRRRFLEIARKQMQERWKSRQPPEERRCLELSEQYHKATNPEEKERILAELRKAVEAAFDARIKERLRRVEQMEQQLKQIRQRIQERQANRDKIVEARIEELTRDPKYRWNW